jgi:hypothetical protein
MVGVSLLCVLLYVLIIAVYYLVLLVINASDRKSIVVADPSVIECAGSLQPRPPSGIGYYVV